MEYRVELDIYNGPMDLLLYLIKRDELDIHDIHITRITTTYMEYLKMLQGMTDELDINIAGDFLVMAATLMEIKSALLLPRLIESTDPNAPSTAEDLTDPRYELVQKLLEYKRFKDSAMLLEQKALIHAQRFPRYPATLDRTGSDEPPPLDLEEVQIWDLLDAFTRLMHEVGLRKTVHEVIYDDTPIDLHAADIEDRLNREGKLSLRQLILERKTKSQMIGVFLAILELTRQKKILVVQTEDIFDIEILPAPEEHQRTYQEAMMDDDTKTAVEEPPTLFDNVTETEEPTESITDDIGIRNEEEDTPIKSSVADSGPDDDVSEDDDDAEDEDEFEDDDDEDEYEDDDDEDDDTDDEDDKDEE